MPNPTRQEIIEARLARIWAEQVQQYDAEHELTGRNYSSDPMRAAANFILAHTNPPTMAEIEWDDDKHFLAEAEHPDLGKVVMLRESVLIIFVQPIEKRIGDIHTARVEELTPTGKRYTLTEVQE